MIKPQNVTMVLVGAVLVLLSLIVDAGSLITP